MPNKTNNRLQGGKFDKIFRENMSKNYPTIVEHVLGLDLTTLEELKDDIQYTKERETDLLKKVKDKDGNVFILHVEFQRFNQKTKMVYRMAEYSIMLQRKHKLPVLQYVIYIGMGKATMITNINTKDLQFRYNLIALSAVDHHLFLKAEKVEEKMLAILGNLNHKSPSLLLKQILLDIKDTAVDELSAERYVKQLHVLVQLRNFTTDLETVMEAIGSFFKIEKDPFYIKGQQAATQRERAKADRKIAKMAREMATKLKSKDVSVSEIAELTNLSIEEIQSL
jgi:predicted transposase/invertase (TIGR01784 family)